MEYFSDLDASLGNEPGNVLARIEEAERIKTKMGYWSSSFHLPFFLTELAGILMDQGKCPAVADPDLVLLKDLEAAEKSL
jgi:hypothetical protein